METICLEELKRIELDILIYIDQVCRENELRYYLCGGTLLGAIRHKGFIPWDDDVDICMPRPDYDRMVKIISNANNRFKILQPAQDTYYYTFSKVVDSETLLYEDGYQPIDDMGVCVDVFPMEGMPPDEFIREKHFTALDKLRKRINSFSLLKPKIRKNLIKYANNLKLYHKNKNACLSKYQKDYEQLAKQYDYENAEYVYATGGAYGKRDIFLKTLFLSGVAVEFERHFFMAPEKWDLYLKQLYGDYMQMPPIDQRVSRHNCKALHK